MKRNKYLFPFLLSIVVPGLLLLFLSLIGVTEILDRKISDGLFASFPSHHKFSKDIVIIDIDEQSLAKYADNPEFGRWPWKRTVYSSLLSYTHLLSKPKIVIFDILFTSVSDHDYALANANTTFNDISHAGSLRDERGVTQVAGEDTSTRKYQINLPSTSPFHVYQSAAFPIGEIGKTAPFIHIVNVIPDNDGVQRRFSPVMRWHEYHYPTLAFHGFGQGKEVEVKLDRDILRIKRGELERDLPLGENGLVRAYYYTEEELKDIPRYSASGVIDSLYKINAGEVDDPSKLMVPPDVFDNKIVIIGTSASATHDDVIIPYGRFPGVIAQAVFTSNMLEGHFLREIPEIWGFFFALSLLVLSTYILFFTDYHSLRLIFPLFAIVLFMAASYILYRNDQVLPPSQFMISFPISFLLSSAYLTYSEGKEKRQFNSILRNLVDPGVVSQALEDMDALKKGGEWEITAFFSDVAGFSSISEELTASELARLLNEYLSAMTLILKKNSGTLDKYIGDAIVGIFSAPVQYADHPRLACKSSLEMVERLMELKEAWQAKMDFNEKARNMTFRIGLNCGPAKVGFMGTDSLASYTMMGDTVNLASRLEAAAKDYGVDILTSESIEAACNNEFYFRYLDRIRVKGKNAPVKIYGLVCRKADATSDLLKGESEYRKAFQAYTEQKWKESIEGFEKALEYFGKSDVSTNLLIKRCKILFQEPPGEIWDGVFTRTTK